jgi:hypothetical protein
LPLKCNTCCAIKIRVDQAAENAKGKGEGGIMSVPGDRLYRACLALAQLALADDGLVESEHEADVRRLAQHLENEILLWVAREMMGACAWGAAHGHVAGERISAIEQHRLAVAAGGRALWCRPAIVGQVEQRGLLGLAYGCKLRAAHRDDVASDVTLAVDLDRARDHGEISSTWIPSMPESSKLNTWCSAFSAHSRRASASAAALIAGAGVGNYDN